MDWRVQRPDPAVWAEQPVRSALPFIAMPVSATRERFERHSQSNIAGEYLRLNLVKRWLFR